MDGLVVAVDQEDLLVLKVVVVEDLLLLDYLVVLLMLVVVKVLMVLLNLVDLGQELMDNLDYRIQAAVAAAVVKSKVVLIPKVVWVDQELLLFVTK
tara:strand:- start:18 stop:305 length:288 start_codon:yes stop_codon:yes gene_type:complete